MAPEKEIRKYIDPDQTINAISLDRAALRDKSVHVYKNIPRPSYALPMAWRCAVWMSNQLVDTVPRYSSADHGSIFKSLLAVTNNVLRAAETEFKGPHFDIVLEHDEAVQTGLDIEYHILAHLNLEISLSEGIWRLSYDVDDDFFLISLSPPQRRTALTLLDHKVEFLSMPPELQEILSNESSPDKTIPLVLATGMREIEFLGNSVPNAWRRLASRIGFTIEEAVKFQAFIQSLLGKGKLWFRTEALQDIFYDFAEEKGLVPFKEDRFNQLVEFFSASPEILVSWGIATPFVRIGEWLAYWPFAHHILPPSLTFLTLLMRKHPEDWNNTVGSELAKVADAVCAELPDIDGLFFATNKVKKGIGDIDLAIYDSRLRVLLLCEIKTVFDRFRTNYQLSNFTGQRVNYKKASAQLKISADAIERGVWQISDIFNRKLCGPPARILPLVLTWYDQYNPWVGMDTINPESCNFRVFRYLFAQSNGDLVKVYEAIAQLSRIYCVASLRSSQLPVGDESIAVKREVQTDLLPPERTLNDMPISNFVKKEIKTLSKLPLDWTEQLADLGQSRSDYHIYAFDEP